jgi:hypothetical protein
VTIVLHHLPLEQTEPFMWPPSLDYFMQSRSLDSFYGPLIWLQ